MTANNLRAPNGGRRMHVLLTKFNLRLPYLTGAPPGLDESWLERRLALFADWPVRSVALQTLRPAAWLVFVDAETPAVYLSRLSDIGAGLATIVPMAGVPTDEDIGAVVRDHLPSEIDTLITTRLDNDDALAASYIERISDHADSWRGFINAGNGLQFAGSRLFRCWDRSGPFLSLVEQCGPIEAPHTVFSVSHHRAAELGPVRQVGGRPLWLQVIHGENLGNRALGFPYSRSRAESALGWSLPEPSRLPTPHQLVKAGGAQVIHEMKWHVRRLTTRQ